MGTKRGAWCRVARVGGWRGGRPYGGSMARARACCGHTPWMEAAFFDLDKTVIAKASMVAFSRPLLQAGMISRRILLRATWSQLVFNRLGADEDRMRKFRESALRITKGWDQARVKAVVEEALISVVEPIVYDEALEEMRSHAAAGRRVLIVSASPMEVVEPLARYLGADEAIASLPEVDDRGRYTGEVELYAYGPYKAEAMRAVAERDGIDLAASYAYSDSMTDLPMLEAVGHPVAVNPDRELAKTARERGWEIRIFRTTVPLRERVPMPASRVLAYLAVGASAAVAMGLVWWIVRRPGASSPPARPEQRRRPGRSTSSYRPTLGAWGLIPPGKPSSARRAAGRGGGASHAAVPKVGPGVATGRLGRSVQAIRLLGDLWHLYRSRGVVAST